MIVGKTMTIQTIAFSRAIERVENKNIIKFGRYFY